MDEMEQMAEFFNIRADGYEAHMLGCEDDYNYYNMISKPVIETQEKIEILDLGCGTGLELESIFKKCPNANVTGVDMSEGMLEKLKSKYDEFSKQLNLINGSYLDIKFLHNSYDYVVSSMTMHHFTYETKKCLYSNIKSYLKKNSGIYIEGDYVVDEPREKQYLEQYYERVKSDDKNIYHVDIPFTVQSQKKLFIEAGFSKVEVVYHKRDAAVLVAEL